MSSETVPTAAAGAADATTGSTAVVLATLGALGNSDGLVAVVEGSAALGAIGSGAGVGAAGTETEGAGGGATGSGFVSFDGAEVVVDALAAGCGARPANIR